jgi:hypothetical protein
MVSSCKSFYGYIPPPMDNFYEQQEEARNKPAYEAPDGAALGSCHYGHGGASSNSGCKWCGCSRHLDAFVDRVCWCDACSLDFDWKSAIQDHRDGRSSCYDGPEGTSHNSGCSRCGCSRCGCSRHLDSFGDRVCWCDVCSIDIDWESAIQAHRDGRSSNMEAAPYQHNCKVCGDGVCWCDGIPSHF